MNSGFETATSREKKMMMQRTLNQLKPNFEMKSKRESEIPKATDQLISVCMKCGAKYDNQHGCLNNCSFWTSYCPSGTSSMQASYQDEKFLSKIWGDHRRLESIGESPIGGELESDRKIEE